MNESVHIAVMAREAIDALKPRSGGRFIDATLGGATHTAALLTASAPDGRVLSIDVDPVALQRARERFAAEGDRWVAAEGNFRFIATIAKEHGMSPADGILFDLGLSSDELADPTKGITFQLDAPLDMRLGPTANEDGLTASDIVNTWHERDIVKLLREFGEERFARQIAASIVKARKAGRITRTLDLVSVIKMAVPQTYEHGRIHPATRTFQALRIVVNDELEALRDAIKGAIDTLAPGGRLAVISFHSLEDRIVKNAFRDSEDLEIITKKPLVPTDEEIAQNPRARSAKLRIAEKRNPNTQKNYAHVRPRHDTAS